MSPFNRPRTGPIDEEPVSPRTMPHNYVAPRESAVPNTKTSGRSEPHSSQPRRSFERNVRRLESDRVLVYNGKTLGKREHQRHVRPPPPKRRCLSSSPRVPGQVLNIPLLSQQRPYPSQTITSDEFLKQNMDSRAHTFNNDPDLRLLNMQPGVFSCIIWPPNPLPPHIYSAGYGNETVGGGHRYPNWVGRDYVHPIFRSMMLPFGNWDYVSSSHDMHIAYPQLYHALQLATRFISNRDSLVLFHRLLFEEPEKLTRESAFYNAEIVHFPEQKNSSDHSGSSGLTEQQRILTTDALAALTRHIRISFGSSKHDSTTWAHTKRVPTQDLNRAYQTRLQRLHSDSYQHSSTALRGRQASQSTLPYHLPFLQPLAPTPASLSAAGESAHGSVMASKDHNLIHTRNTSLNERFGVFIDDTSKTLPHLRGTNVAITLNPLFLRYLHKDTYPKIGYHARLYVLFFLAVTLVHELAHAVWMCRTAPPMENEMDIDDSDRTRFHKNKREHEPFINDDRKSELGKAWETSVFGGFGFVEPLGQLGGASDAATSWGDLFMMGLGCRQWPDDGESFVEVGDGKRKRYRPFARLWEDQEGESTPQPLSGPRTTKLRILPFEFVYNFFDYRFWDWVDARPEGLKTLLGMELDRCVEVERVNVDWGCVPGARAVDWNDALGFDDEELECDEGPEECSEEASEWSGSSCDYSGSSEDSAYSKK
jgi:hypothetical protein